MVSKIKTNVVVKVKHIFFFLHSILCVNDTDKHGRFNIYTEEHICIIYVASNTIYYFREFLVLRLSSIIKL